jgi:hypothetical protein
MGPERGEAEDYPLLEAATKERLMKKYQAGKRAYRVL